MATHEARKAETRRKILTAARSLFEERGMGTTVEEIVAAADVAKGTFFYHFPTRDDLLRSLGRAGMGVIAQRVLARKLAPLDAVRALLVESAREGQKAPEFMREYLTAAFRAGREDLSAPRAHRPDAEEARSRDVIATLLGEAQARGELRDDVPAAELGAMLGFMVLAVDLTWIAEGARKGQQGLVARVERALDVFVKGAGRKSR